MTTLEDLWYGNIEPQETKIEGNRRFKRLLLHMDDNRDRLADVLSEQQRNMLDSYDAVVNEMYSVAEQLATAFPSQSD